MTMTMKRKMILLGSALCIWLMSGCSKGQLPSLEQQTREKMEELAATGQLATTEYTVEKVVKADDCAWWKLGDRKILFSLRAYLQGGIDMAKYDTASTRIDEEAKAIELTLPRAEVLSVDIPAEEIKLKYMKVGMVRYDFSAADRNQLLRQGESDIRADIPDMGILEDAEASARRLFTSMLREMGYEHVTVNFE